MFENRLKQIMDALQDSQAAVVTDGANRFYLTGLRSSAGILIIMKSTAYLLIDSRYYEKAKNTVKNCVVIQSGYSAKHVYNQLKKLNISLVYMEAARLSVAESKKYLNAFESIQIDLSDWLDNKLRSMRSIKSLDEIAAIKNAQRITDKTFEYILNSIKIGKTEKDIALDMEFYIRRLGSEGVSFDFIVVSGKNSSLPHGTPGDKQIEFGDFITMDFGAVVDGYRSDMTRTIAVGDVTDEQRRVYQTVLDAQLAAIAVIAPGKVCSDVDKIAREIIDSKGYTGCFGHGLGHSVGIEIHENPCLNTVCDEKLQLGMVLTVEPGIYIENKFGVRIEDMVVVTNNGCDNLTGSKKELIIV